MTNMDDAFSNMAAIKFENILNQIRSSSLNFQMSVTPFTAVIHLKKSITKDKSGNFLHQSTFVNRTNGDLEVDELRTKNLALEQEIANLKSSCSKASKSLAEIERKLEILNRQHENVNMEIYDDEDEEESYDKDTHVNEKNCDEDEDESEDINEDSKSDNEEDYDEEEDEDDEKNENEDNNEKNEEKKEVNEDDKNGNEEENKLPNETTDSGVDLYDSMVPTPGITYWPDENFRCNFCPRVFMYKWEYNGHRLREHNICKNCKRFIEPKGQHIC